MEQRPNLEVTSCTLVLKLILVTNLADRKHEKKNQTNSFLLQSFHANRSEVVLWVKKIYVATRELLPHNTTVRNIQNNNYYMSDEGHEHLTICLA